MSTDCKGDGVSDAVIGPKRQKLTPPTQPGPLESHRMAWVKRGIKGNLVPAFRPWAGAPSTRAG